MKRWKRQDVRKAVINYHKTGDIQNLMDIPRILAYSKLDIIKSLAGARLKEILIKIYFYSIISKEMESSNEIH